MSVYLVAGTIVNRYFHDIFPVESRASNRITRRRRPLGGKASRRPAYASQLTLPRRPRSNMLPVLAVTVFCIATWASALNDPLSGKSINHLASRTFSFRTRFRRGIVRFVFKAVNFRTPPLLFTCHGAVRTLGSRSR